MMKNLADNIKAILITGPTASGKSALAVDLAKQHNGVVINADSMQVYDTLRVLTARPSPDDMEGVEHLLYGHVAASQTYSTGQWLRDVTSVIAQTWGRGQLPVLVGGTGLYFKALTGGLSDMPQVPADIRAHYRMALAQDGAEALHAELARRDPEMAETLNPGDSQRIVRALEIVVATGQSLKQFQAKPGQAVIEPEHAEKFVVLPERPVLHQRINTRFEKMLDAGAVEEVQALLALEPEPDAPALKAIGVSQIAAMLEGRIDRDAVIETASAATRQYAKRQMTWFRNQMGEDWQRLS
jgi:tRNA dimethylallyltransferase